MSLLRAGLVGGVAAAWCAFAFGVEQRARKAYAKPAPPPAPSRASWTRLPNPARVEQGRTYRADVELPTFVPTSLATEERARSYAADRGFRLVALHRERPADWPRDGSEDAELWAEAERVGPTASFEFPGGLLSAWVRG